MERIETYVSFHFVIVLLIVVVIVILIVIVIGIVNSISRVLFYVVLSESLIVGTASDIFITTENSSKMTLKYENEKKLFFLIRSRQQSNFAVRW